MYIYLDLQFSYYLGQWGHEVHHLHEQAVTIHPVEDLPLLVIHHSTSICIMLLSTLLILQGRYKYFIESTSMYICNSLVMNFGAKKI